MNPLVQAERAHDVGAEVVERIGIQNLPMREVWIAVRASLRSVLERVTLADVVAGELPDHVRSMLGDEDAWVPH